MNPLNIRNDHTSIFGVECLPYLYTYLVGRKILNKTFSYNFCCLAAIMGLFFNPPDGLWLWYRRSSFLCFSKGLLGEIIEWKFLHFFVPDTKLEWGRKHCRSPSTVYDINKSMNAGECVNRRTAAVQRLLWIVTACGIPFEELHSSEVKCL